MNILMPQLGETVAEGTVTVWHKAVGDRVAAGDTLFEIETEKTTMEVPTTKGGILSEVRVPAGTTVPIGTIVAVISEAPDEPGDGAGGGARVPHADRGTPDPFRPVRTPSRNYGPVTHPGGAKATPAARRLAAESGVDLRTLQGSTRHGHITARDVEAALRDHADKNPTRIATAAGGPQAGSASPARTAEGEPGQSHAVRSMYASGSYNEVPLDAMRRTIARRLLEAKQSIPHFYLSQAAQVEHLLQLRTELNSEADADSKASLTDWLIRAVALALQRVPEANAAWAGDALLRFHRSDVAVAVAVDGGLYTPVIRQAESKSLRVLSAEMKRLTARCRANVLSPDEYRGGAITLSNLGMYGVRNFAAIVNPPQAAVLAVGAAERHIVEGPHDTVRFSRVMELTLSCDHRVIDGVVGARLLTAIRTLLESPALLLV